MLAGIVKVGNLPSRFICGKESKNETANSKFLFEVIGEKIF